MIGLRARGRARARRSMRGRGVVRPMGDPGGVISAGEAHMSAVGGFMEERVGRIIRQHVLKRRAEMAGAARTPRGGELASRRS